MQHRIDDERHGPRGAAMARAVEKCVHCGFCLETCPTYSVLGDEGDSPRGRIFLMKEVLEGGLSVAESVGAVDRCLGCLACETSCPSGVAYGELLSSFRALAEGRRRRTVFDRALRGLVTWTLRSPGRFRLAAFSGRFARPLRGVLPARVRAMLDLLPGRLAKPERLPRVAPAVGERRGRVALLAGCAQQALAPGLGPAAIRVLTRAGVEVVVPRRQVCCGALALHTGLDGQAASLARRNLQAFPTDVDAIVTTAAGCGSGLAEYPLLFAGQPEEESARAFAGRVRDIAVFLDELGVAASLALPNPATVVYHDACHLQHAQRAGAAPRRLLESVGNLRVLTPAEPEICCGSAGTYNIEQPDVAAELGERKVRHLLATGAEAIVTGNIGCAMQIRSHLAPRPDGDVPVLHTVEVIDRALRGEGL